MSVIPKGFFQDAVNPTDDEIIRWAYTNGAHYPPEMAQDWDLCITTPSRADLFLQLASDIKCPNRIFFLSCLYLLIGDAIRSNGHTWHIEEASTWVDQQSRELPEDVVMFLKRSRELILNPYTFDYHNWCAGGYAYD